MLKSTSVERSGTTYARYQQIRDDLGRVTQETQDGLLFTGYGTGNAVTVNYAYDTRGQLASADSKVNGNTVSLSDRFFSAAYDNAANRATENRYSTSTSATYQETYTPDGTAYTPPYGIEGLGLGAAGLWRGCSGPGSAGSMEGSVPI